MASGAKQLPVIALLGATGNTGKEALRTLLARECYSELRIYVRSAKKLQELFPGIQGRTNIRLCIGPLSDIENMQRCLKEADIILSTLGSNNHYVSTVLRESSQVLIQALQSLKHENAIWKKPRLIYLSSASWNQHFSQARPPMVDWLIKSAFQTGYDDLRAAEAMILDRPELCSMLRVQPNVLVEEEATGMEISTETVRLGVSYADLGAAFVELATQPKYESLEQVGVSSTGGDSGLRYAPIIVSRISAGLFANYFPGSHTIHGILRSLGWS